MREPNQGLRQDLVDLHNGRGNEGSYSLLNDDHLRVDLGNIVDICFVKENLGVRKGDDWTYAVKEGAIEARELRLILNFDEEVLR